MGLAMGRLFRRWARDTRGATAVEFAIISIPFLALIVASAQTAIVYFEQQALQTAADQSARALMTGSAQLANTTQAGFQNIVCGYAVNFTCADLMVDVESANSYSNLNPQPLSPTYNASGAVTNTWAYSPGNPGDIVILRVMYDLPVIGGPLGFSLANQANGDALLVGTAVVKNEPY